MVAQLVADRFLAWNPRGSGTALDLASGHPVQIRSARSVDAGDPHRWARRCAWLAESWHPHVLPLLDFIELNGRRFEIFLAPTRASTYSDAARNADALHSALAHFHHHERSAGLLDGRSLLLVDGRVVVQPHSLTGIPVAELEEARRDGLERAWTSERARAADLLERVRVRKVGGVRQCLPSLESDKVLARLRWLQERLEDLLESGVMGWPRACRLEIPATCETTHIVSILARQARLCGYVPVSVRMLGDRHPLLERERLWELLARRHVCLLDEGSATDRAWLFVARLAGASPRPHVLVHLTATAGAQRPAFRAERVAEQVACYHTKRSRFEPPSFVAGDPEVVRCRASILASAEMVEHGRHAAADRALRHALGALTRRMDASHAGEAAMLLAHVELTRGRAPAAVSLLEQAQRLFDQAGRSADALEAAAFAGLASTDAGRFEEAEAALRGVIIAAAGLAQRAPGRVATLGLARCLLWRDRPREALDALLVPSATSDAGPEADDRAKLREAPPACLREACPAPLLLDLTSMPTPWRIDEDVARAALCARAAAVAGDLRLAVASGLQARDHALRTGRPVELATACAALAAAHGWVGDAESVRRVVREGMTAARAAHAPLRSLRLRLVLVEALRRCGCGAESDRVLRRLSRLNHARLPAPLRLPLERLLRPGSIVSASSNQRRGMAETLVEVLDACQGADDEREQAKASLTIVCRRTRAISVALFGAVDGHPLLLVDAGVGRASADVARRCLDTGRPLPPPESVSKLEAAVPIRWAGAVVGVLYCRWPADASPEWVETGGILATVAAALSPAARVLVDRRPRSAQQEPEPVPELIGDSEVMRTLRQQVVRLASAPFNVLIEGESGSGKELVARALHRLGPRRHRRFCAVNCAALTDELLETELFGHARGAFTGAVAERRGLFEEADGGTLLLDEVGELSARAQAKLLRAIQEGEIRRVGENHVRPVDVRLVAATNRALGPAAAAGSFRHDLLYRLAVTRLVVPPLRERAEDIRTLATHFFQQAADRIGSRATLSAATLTSLTGYNWPGNVRELQNVMAALAVAANRRGRVGPELLPGCIAGVAVNHATTSLDQARRLFEARYVKAALARAGGRRGQAARDLGLSRQGLAKLMARLEIEAEVETA
jgi:DNA-binding NtrC family response regulator